MPGRDDKSERLLSSFRPLKRVHTGFGSLRSLLHHTSSSNESCNDTEMFV